MDITLYKNIEKAINKGCTIKQFEKQFNIKLLKKKAFINNQTDKEYLLYFIDDNTIVETFKNKVTDIFVSE